MLGLLLLAEHHVELSYCDKTVGLEVVGTAGFEPATT